MVPPPRRYRIRKSNNLGINFAPKSIRLFQEDSDIKGITKHDKCISRHYPFIFLNSEKSYMEVHIWDSVIKIDSINYKALYSMRHPCTFYRRELIGRPNSKSRSFDNYLYGPLNHKKYRTVGDFEEAH